MKATVELEKLWQRLFSECSAEARRRGATDPQFYFEGGSGLVVTDGPSHTESGKPRQDAIVIHIPWPRGVVVDTGAW